MNINGPMKAFTVHKVNDEHHTYWIVPMHDVGLVPDEKFAMQLFHSEEEAQRYADAHKGKNNQ